MPLEGYAGSHLVLPRPIRIAQIDFQQMTWSLIWHMLDACCYRVLLLHMYLDS